MGESADKLVIAISSRALFQLEQSNEIYENEGIEAYRKHQIEHEDEILKPGKAFAFIRKVLKLNEPPYASPGSEQVEVMLLSRNTVDTGLRVFKSMSHYFQPEDQVDSGKPAVSQISGSNALKLAIKKAAFTGGAEPWRYANSFGCHLFLSDDEQDVSKALANQVPSARLLYALPEDGDGLLAEDELPLKIAFDGDAVLFSNDSDQLYRNEGLEAFEESEAKHKDDPLAPGPLKPFLESLCRIQAQAREKKLASPIRTSLVTARSFRTTERVVNTFRSWNIPLDESHFLNGGDKTACLNAFNADIFFDDQKTLCDSASAHLPAGHLPQPEKSSGESGE